MTPEELAVLRDSLRDMRSVGPAAAEAFYAELFRLEPSVPELFHLPGKEQSAIFLHELDALLSAVSDLPSFVMRARRLGRLHAGRGVRAEHFRSAATALDAMLRAVYGADLSPAVNLAWRHAYGIAAQVMQEALFA
jgi:methyl-accepting chemotaxis protein/nitric oxide dioxygenase